MKLRQTIAGLALTATLVTGGATAAFADAPPVPPNPTPAQCKAAAHRLHELKVVDRHLKAEYVRLVHLRNAAEKAGKDELVAKLDAKLAKAKARHEAAAAKVKARAAAWKAACAADAQG